MTYDDGFAFQSENYRLSWLYAGGGGANMASTSFRMTISNSPPSNGISQSENFGINPVLARPEDSNPGFSLIHVPGDQPTIQAGLLAASWGDTVEVACGTYYESNINLVSGVLLRAETVGGETDCVILDPQSTGRGFYCQNVLQATISGFTIINGYAASSGGGALFSDCQVTISDCRFATNLADNSGGALYGTRSSLNFISCKFTENQANHGGAMMLAESSATLTGCNFFDNSALYYGGALRFKTGSSPSIHGCTFAGNNSGSSGAVLLCTENSNPVFSACTLYGNSATSGSILRMGSGSFLVMENSILAESPSGAALSCTDATASLQCCNVYNNAGGDWTGCIAGQESTNGNLNTDPLFCDAGSGNFTLWANSPCTAGANPGCDLIGAWPVGCSLIPDNNVIGLYTDTAGSINQLNVATGEVFTLYLVVTNLQDDTGIGGFELSLPVPEGVTQLQTTIYNVDSNTGTAPEIRVTLSEPLIWAETMVLAEINYQTTTPAMHEFFINATNTSYVEPPMPNSLGAAAPFLYTSLVPSSGAVELPVFLLNDPLSRQPETDTPVNYQLKRCYPNPFNPMVNIRYELPKAGRTTIRIFDVKGRLVCRLLDEERPAGHHTLIWDGHSTTGNSVASGIYLVKMQAGNFTAQQKITLVR